MGSPVCHMDIPFMWEPMYSIHTMDVSRYTQIRTSISQFKRFLFQTVISFWRKSPIEIGLVFKRDLQVCGASVLPHVCRCHPIPDITRNYSTDLCVSFEKEPYYFYRDLCVSFEKEPYFYTDMWSICAAPCVSLPPHTRHYKELLHRFVGLF